MQFQNFFKIIYTFQTDFLIHKKKLFEVEIFLDCFVNNVAYNTHLTNVIAFLTHHNRQI